MHAHVIQGRRARFEPQAHLGVGAIARSAMSLTMMSEYGIELDDVRIRTESQSQSHALLPPVPVSPSSERTRDVRLWRVLELSISRTTVCWYISGAFLLDLLVRSSLLDNQPLTGFTYHIYGTSLARHWASRESFAHAPPISYIES